MLIDALLRDAWLEYIPFEFPRSILTVLRRAGAEDLAFSAGRSIPCKLFEVTLFPLREGVSVKMKISFSHRCQLSSRLPHDVCAQKSSAKNSSTFASVGFRPSVIDPLLDGSG